MNWYKTSQNNIEPIKFDSSPGYHTVKLGPATIIYQINEDGSVQLASLRVPQKYRRQGFAKRILAEFTKWLDKENLSSTLGASPLDKKTNPIKLEKLYSEFGYSPTGKYINPAFDIEMIRNPNKG